MTGIWMWSDSLAAIGAEKAVSLCCQAGITDAFFLAKGLSGCDRVGSADFGVGVLAHVPAYLPSGDELDQGAKH